MKARVIVTLKGGVLDPQGKAIEGALGSLGIDGITSVRQGKLFDIRFNHEDPDAAMRSLRRACDELLANTVIENYSIKVTPPKPGAETVVDRSPSLDPISSRPGIDQAMEDAATAAEMPTEGHP